MTKDALRPVERSRLYEQLVERVLDHVVEEGLGPGQRLPTERALAERLHVSRASVRQAIVALEVQGVVEVRHGDGTYLLPSSTPKESLSDLLERRRRLPDVLETREALEVKLAELAAVRRTTEDLTALDTALERMEADIAGGGNGAAADEEFHRAVTLAAKNALMSEIMASLAERIKETRMESLSQEGRPELSLDGHRAIADAIRRAEPEVAASAMRDHIKLVGNVEVLNHHPLAQGR